MKRLAMKRLAWIGGIFLLVAGFLSSCAKAPEQKIVSATAGPYHVGDYELVLDPVAGTGELKPLVSTFAVSSFAGGGLTIGVRGQNSSYTGGVFSQDWCVYNANNVSGNPDIYGIAIIVMGYTGGQPTVFGGTDGGSCMANSCGACGTHSGPYYWSFWNKTATFKKGFIPWGSATDCSAANSTAWKTVTITTPVPTSIILSLMIYEPSGEVVDADAGRGISTAPTAINGGFVLFGKQQADPAFPLLCNGNYKSALAANTFLFPVTTTTTAVPAHAVTVGLSGYGNATVYNTTLNYTIMPIRAKTLPSHYAVGNYNSSLNQGWNASPVATVSLIDTINCNQVLGVGLGAPDISYPDVYNLSLDVLLGPSITKHMVGGTACGGNTTDQYQDLPSNLMAPGQTEYLPGIRTPQITNAYGILNATEYWIIGTGGYANTWVGIGANVASSALVAIVNAGPQDAPIGFSSILTSLNIRSYGYRKNVNVTGNTDGQTININIDTTGRVAYTVAGLNTVGLVRPILLIGLNAIDFTDNDMPVRLGAMSLAATSADSVASKTMQVAYTNMSALGQPQAKPVMAVFAADLEGVTTNEGTIAVLYRQNLSGDFGARTFSKWLKLTSMDWTGIQAGVGTNMWVGFSDPDNVVTSNFGLMQIQAGTRQTITSPDGNGSWTLPFQFGVWQLISNPSTTSGFVFPDLPAGCPGVLPTISTQSIDIGTSAAEIPSGPYYSGWDSNANLYDVLNRGMIGYGTDDTLASDSLSMNKFNVGGAKAICPRPMTYLAAGPVRISGYIAAYQWDIVSASAATCVKISIKWKDQVGNPACSAPWTGNSGGCTTYYGATVSGGVWNAASVPLATNQYNKVSINPCGAGSACVTSQTSTNWTCNSTGGGGESMVFCTGAPSGSNAAGAASICTNSGGPLCL